MSVALAEDAEPARSLVVLALGEAAAARAAERLKAMLGARPRNTPARFRRVRRAKAPPGGLALRWSERFGAPEVLVSCVDPMGWVQLAKASPALFSIAYVRPGLMPVRDVVGSLRRRTPVSLVQWEDLSACDLLLKGCPVLAEEDLFGGGPTLGARLAQWLELPPAAVSPPSDVEGYARSLEEAVGPPAEGHVQSERAPVGVFPVRTGGAGLALLETGWSYDEPDRVWSDAATMTLRLPPVPPRRVLLCRLVGELAHRTSGMIRVRASVAGAGLGEVARSPCDPPGFDLDLRLPGRDDGAAQILELIVDGAFRPSDTLPGGDERLLGFALTRIELRDGGLSPAAGGSIDPLWKALLRRRPPRTALVLGRSEQEVDAAARALRALGCAEVRPIHPRDDDAGAGVLDALAPLVGASVRVDLVVLCDSSAARAWFAALPHPPVSTIAECASLILMGGEPALWPEGLVEYAQAWSALIEVSDRSTLVETWAAP